MQATLARPAIRSLLQDVVQQAISAGRHLLAGPFPGRTPVRNRRRTMPRQSAQLMPASVARGGTTTRSANSPIRASAQARLLDNSASAALAYTGHLRGLGMLSKHEGIRRLAIVLGVIAGPAWFVWL